VHIDAHLAINIVLLPTWLRRIKNRNSYQLLLDLLGKCASQPLSYLPSIIHIEKIVPYSLIKHGRRIGPWVGFVLGRVKCWNSGRDMISLAQTCSPSATRSVFLDELCVLSD